MMPRTSGNWPFSTVIGILSHNSLSGGPALNAFNLSIAKFVARAVGRQEGLLPSKTLPQRGGANPNET
jgi:hypothetical protein